MDGCWRICDLVTTSLVPYIEPRCSALTEETEKNMLISLSMVCRKIKQWTGEDDWRFQQNMGLRFEGPHDCLANVVSTMVAFLNVDSQFIQHVAGNILSSLSLSLFKNEKKWVDFIHMLKITLEAAISSICSLTSLPSASKLIQDENLMLGYPLIFDEKFEMEDPRFEFNRYIVCLQVRLEKVGWHIIAAVFRILRNILKSVKLEDSDLEGVFLNIFVSSLINLPWDLFSGIYVDHSYKVQVNSVQVGLLNGKNGFNEIKGVLVGTILQLFCSLVDENSVDDGTVNPLGEIAVQSRFSNLVPQLLSCCFSKCLGHKDKRLSQYLRHKMLILMIRLSFDSQWQFSHPAMWLKLHKLYFTDLINNCPSSYDTGSENCLQGSPFLASIEDADIPIRHLQRLAIFLHFKCSFTLICLKESEQGCPCATEALSVTSELQFCSEKCCYTGILELSEWLKSCGFLEKSMHNEDYSRSCSRFALSFLQLYLEEDDMFFKMLLLLLDAPFFSLPELGKAVGASSRKVERDVIYHMKNIFDPVHLFHLFLLLLHYDHLVLIDHLISKDTGVQCAQYLLRCLRIVCKSWYMFIDFSCGSETSQRYLKRKKISVDNNCSGKLPSSSTGVMEKLLCRKRSGKSHRNSVNSFENATECLLSLKRAVANLHQKSLFPYNPRPLLRSLGRLEELYAQ